jgi:hypothetical protein
MGGVIRGQGLGLVHCVERESEDTGMPSQVGNEARCSSRSNRSEAPFLSSRMDRMCLFRISETGKGGDRRLGPE